MSALPQGHRNLPIGDYTHTGAWGATTNITAGTGLTVTTGNLTISAGNISLNTNGTAALLSTYTGANSSGNNIFVGNGGQVTLGAVGETYKGSNNTSIGMYSLQYTTTGFYNTATGRSALRNNTTGAYNTANGMYSLYANIAGAKNTAVGYNAGYNTLGSLNIFLGYNAGYHETGSNTLYIANSDTATPLIYGNFSTAALTINGTLKVTSGLPSPQLVTLKAIDENTALTVVDGITYWTVPSEMNGWTIESVNAAVYTVSSSGTPTIQLCNVTDSADILSTPVTIDVNEKNSYTAAAGAVVSAGTLATGDVIRVDVDVTGTGTKGLDVMIMVRLA